MIKIGMVGAHGTGKTSMAEAMVNSPAFSLFELVPSTARQIKAHGYPINREATELSQILVPILRVIDEAEFQVNDYNRMHRQGLISDRTPLDSLAYTMHQSAHVWENGEFVENVMFRLTRMYMRTYTTILYFPIYWDNVDDFVRDTDEKYRREINNNIQTLLEILDIPYLVVPNISPTMRAAWLVDKFDEAAVEESRKWMELFRGML
jgi:GTPase SAR1 family protein